MAVTAETGRSPQAVWTLLKVYHMCANVRTHLKVIMFEFQGNINFGDGIAAQSVIAHVNRSDPEQAAAHFQACLALGGAYFDGIRTPIPLQELDAQDIRLQFDQHVVDLTLLNADNPDAQMCDILRPTEGTSGFVLLDPLLVFEAETIAEDAGSKVCRLAWDEEEDVNQTAPFLLEFDLDGAVAANLLRSTDQHLAGLWDRQLPFIVLSDAPLHQLKVRLENWLRPTVEGLDGKPYFRFWDSASVFSLILSGTMTQKSFLGEIIIGLKPVSHKLLLRLKARDQSGRSDAAHLSTTDRKTINATRRALQSRMLAAGLLEAVEKDERCDEFEDVLSLVQGAASLGHRVGLETASDDVMQARLSYHYGLGYLHDAQYPQLVQLRQRMGYLSQVHVRTLLSEWEQYVSNRAGPPSVSREIDRLAVWQNVSLFHDLGQRHYQEKEVLAYFRQIDSAKWILHPASTWIEITRNWRMYFQELQTEEWSTDTLMLLAYCCGQYFLQDPIRRARIQPFLSSRLPMLGTPRHGW